MNNGNHEDIRKKMETGGLPIGNKESQVMPSPTIAPWALLPQHHNEFYGLQISGPPFAHAIFKGRMPSFALVDAACGCMGSSCNGACA